MPIPADFNNNEHLQAVIRRYINREIREAFRDLNDENGNWEPNVTTSREQMRWALTHQDNDPMNVTVARMMLFYFTFGQAKAMQGDVYGIPITSFDQGRKYKPQICLHFNNRPYENRRRSDYVDGEISFRLMDKSPETITQADLQRYASRIKARFAEPNKFIWHKGKVMASYSDWDKGYQLQLLVTGEAEARRIVENVLDIQGHTPNWKNLNINKNEEPNEAYPDNPGVVTILGQQLQEVRPRPREDVTFRYATLALRNRGKGVNLVDASFSRANPVERVR